MNAPSPKKLPRASGRLTVRQAADTIGVSRQAIERFILARRLPATKIDQGSFSFWLIRRGDLDHYVVNRRTAFSTLPADWVDTNQQ